MKSILVFMLVVFVGFSGGISHGFAQSRGGRRQANEGAPRGEYPSESAPANGSSALDHFKNGSLSYIKGDYKLAIESYNKALALEKKKPTLEKTLWYALINNLGLSYGMTGNPKKEKEIFEYGLSKDPKYPLFYYNLACASAGMNDLDNTISNLKLAFEYKANLMPGEMLPEPADDERLARFRHNDRFELFLGELGN
jgi:tetratricopeptide (TPR) repeat protein